MNLFQLATSGIDLESLPSGRAPAPVEAAPEQSPAFGRKVEVPAEIDSIIQEAAATYGVDPNVVRGVAFAESGFDPDVISGKRRSSAGAVGLMQFMPATAKELDIDPLNVREAIFGGAYYLRKNLDKFDGDYGRAVAAYNWGPNRDAFQRDDWFASIPKETDDYVKRVFAVADSFGAEPEPEKSQQVPLPSGVAPSNAGGGRGSVSPGMINTKMPRTAVPDMTVGGVARDVASGLLQIGPTAVKGVGELARLVSGDNVGKGLTDFADRGNKAIQEVVGSERAQAQRQNFAADMADEGVSIGQALLNNKGAMADMALPQLGSMLIPVGVAGAAGKAATVGKAAQVLDKAALASRVAAAQQAAGIGATAAQNAASTFAELVDKGVSLKDAYLGAGITVPFSVIAGKLTGGGAEGALIRSTLGDAVKKGATEVPKAMLREGGQEMGEELGQALGEAVGTGKAPTATATGKRLAVAGVLGGLMGGGVDIATQAMAPRVEAQPTTPQVPVVTKQEPTIDVTYQTADGRTVTDVVPGNTQKVKPDTDQSQSVDNIAQAILEAEAKAAQPAAQPPTGLAAELEALRARNKTSQSTTQQTTEAADAAPATGVPELGAQAADDSRGSAPAANAVRADADGRDAGLPGAPAPSRAELGAGPDGGRVDGNDALTQPLPESANAQTPTQTTADTTRPLPAARPAAVEAAGPATIPATTGVASESQASQTQQGNAQPTQAGGPQAGAAPTTASTGPTGGNRVQAAGLTNGATTQNTGAQTAPAARTQVQAEGSATRLGRDNTPLNEGGQPFKTRKAAGDAKKLQPMMRVVKVDGGYALAEKTPAQIAAMEKASQRLRLAKTSPAGEPIPAHSFIAAAGGMQAATRNDMGVDGNPRVGNRRLFAGAGRGLSIEQATQMLIADGYLAEGATHNDAYALIKKSLVQPQYNATGYEQMAEMDAATRFDDYLAAMEDDAVDGGEDPFGMAKEFTTEELDEVGFNDADPQLQAEVAALIAQAEASGIDTYAILEDIARTYANATQDQYNAAARDAIAQAIARGNQDGGSTAAQAAPAAESAADQGLGQPPALELASQTPAEAAAQQEAQEQAAKAEAARQRAADAQAARDEERKRIAQASVRAADTFELGQDPLDSLTGQGGLMFSRAQPAIRSAAAAMEDASRRADALYDAEPSTVTMEEFSAVGDARRAAEAAMMDALAQLPDSGFAVEARTSDGRMLIVTPSASEQGRWQLTRFGKDGEPWGDTRFDTKRQALQYLVDEAVPSSIQPAGAAMSRTQQPLRTPAATIRAAIAKAYGKLLGQLESKGLVTLTQTEDEAIEAAAQARADKTGQSVEQAHATLRASVKNSVADQTQTEAFKRWFGDSKVVDADGKPLVVYHGTGEDFDVFDENAPAAHWKMDGFYFAPDPADASRFAESSAKIKQNRLGKAFRPDGANVIPVYLSLQNPKVIEFSKRGQGGFITADEMREMLAEAKFDGHDGAIIKGWQDGSGDVQYVAFRPEQIKSAIGNQGTFDPADPDIRRSADGSIQGFFDPQTGQSFLVADNLTAEAAPGVLMHEVGIHMAADGSMNALFNRAATMLKLQRGNPFIKAVQDRMDSAGETSGEEAAAYIAEAYENDRANAPASVQRWVTDLLAAVKAWMFKKGIMGADRLTVADIAAVARANARSMAQSDGQGGVQLSQRVPGLLYSNAGNNPPPIPTSAQNGLFNTPPWQLPEATNTDKLIYELQDGRVDLKRVQEAIAATGKTITEGFDARLAETLLPGRVARRTETFLTVEAKPLLESMAKNNVSQDELSDYLLARHAPERNAQVAKVNPDMPDGGAGTNSQGVLMTTQAARDHIAALTAGKRTALELLARQVDAITAGTRDILVREGLEKQETIDAWMGAYKHYVPLFKDESMDTMAHPMGSGLSVTGSASRRSTGSTGEVTNMLAHVLMQRETAITRAEKNRAAMSLYGLALTNPNAEMWTTIRPSMPSDQIADELMRMGVDPMEAEAGMQGVPTIRGVDPVSGKVVDRPNPMYKRLDNALTVKVNGEDRVILFNADNERAMRLVRNLKNQDGVLAHLDLAGSFIGKATRYFASINTQYNPAFGMVNVIRDVGGALVNLSDTALAGKQARVLSDSIPAAIGIARDLRGDAQRTPWSELWQQFQDDGGRTGYRDLFTDPYKRAEAVQSELDKLSKQGTLTPGAAAHAVLDLLDDFNTTLENGVRLSAYKAALDQGMSRAESARLARELTLDFNRKGRTGREIGPLFAFFNASVQGTARTLKALQGPAGKRILIGGLGLGVMQALMLAAAGFEDDEIPEFVKARALIIPMPGKQYIAIPLQFGLNALPNTGRVATELLMSGGKDWGEKSFNALGELAGSFNPLGGGNIFTGAGLLKTVAPTVVDPIVDMATNTDFTGKPIGKERMPWDTRPGFSMARESTQRSPTGQVYVGISKAVNSISGGNDFARGLASPSPEEVRYLFTTLGGGVYRELEKVLNASLLTAQGETLKAREVPLGSRFAGEVDDADVQRGRYFKNSARLEKLEAQLKGLSKEGRGEELRALVKENPEIKLYELNNQVSAELAKLNKLAVENVNNKDALKRIDEVRTQYMRALNDKVREMEKASK